MPLNELIPEVKSLNRADKMFLMQFILTALAQDEGIPLFTPGAEYPIWTPLNAFDAAETLSQMLEEHKATL